MTLTDNLIRVLKKQTRVARPLAARLIDPRRRA